MPYPLSSLAPCSLVFCFFLCLLLVCFIFSLANTVLKTSILFTYTLPHRRVAVSYVPAMPLLCLFWKLSSCVQYVPPGAPWSLLLRLYCLRVVPWEVSLFTLVPSCGANGGWSKESECPGQLSLLLRFYELVSPARGLDGLDE